MSNTEKAKCQRKASSVVDATGTVPRTPADVHGAQNWRLFLQAFFEGRRLADFLLVVRLEKRSLERLFAWRHCLRPQGSARPQGSQGAKGPTHGDSIRPMFVIFAEGFSSGDKSVTCVGRFSCRIHCGGLCLRGDK